MGDERRENDRAADEREEPRPLADGQPHPERTQHAFKHTDERGFGHGDEPRPRREEQHARAELDDSEEGEQGEIASRGRPGVAWVKAKRPARAAARAAATGICTVRCHLTTTVAPAKAVAVTRASASPMREPAAGDPHSMITVPTRATLMASHVRRRTPSPRQSHREALR